jgi:hypothetical protein
MMAPMGRGTRAAGGARRRAATPSSAPATAAAPAAPTYSGRPKSGRGATFSVAMMTLAALAAVGVLAAQAEATAPKVRAQGSNASTTKVTSTSKNGSSGSGAVALPANSGSGTRIVYSPTKQRIWLAEGGTVVRTMQVVPGTIAPPNGSFTVYAKTPASEGGDGVAVEFVVRFDSSSSTTYGFDAEANVTGLPPAPTGRTGGVRMAQLDAQALYEFASVGTTVVVL